MLGDSAQFTQQKTSFQIKSTDKRLVVSTRFYGIFNVASRIWTVRDWAKQAGVHLVGSPGCVFASDDGDPHQTLCEVQWGLAGPQISTEGEISVRWLAPRLVLVAYHRGDGLHTTIQALQSWGRANGYPTTGERREIYHAGTKTPARERLTEIQLYVDVGGCRDAHIAV